MLMTIGWVSGVVGTTWSLLRITSSAVCQTLATGCWLTVLSWMLIRPNFSEPARNTPLLRWAAVVRLYVSEMKPSHRVATFETLASRFRLTWVSTNTSQVLRRSVFIRSVSSEEFDDSWPPTARLLEDARPCLHHVACGLLQRCACRITSTHNWHASFRLWHAQFRAWSIPSTAWQTALAQCSWASAVQAGSYGSPVPSRSSAEIPGRPLHPSLRCRQSTASEICQSMLPYCSATSTKHVRPSGLRWWGSNGLVLITGQSPWSIVQQQ